MGIAMALRGITCLQTAVDAMERVASEVVAAGGLASSTPLATLDRVKKKMLVSRQLILLKNNIDIHNEA